METEEFPRQQVLRDLNISPDLPSVIATKWKSKSAIENANLMCWLIGKPRRPSDQSATWIDVDSLFIPNDGTIRYREITIKDQPGNNVGVRMLIPANGRVLENLAFKDNGVILDDPVSETIEYDSHTVQEMRQQVSIVGTSIGDCLLKLFLLHNKSTMGKPSNPRDVYEQMRDVVNVDSGVYGVCIDSMNKDFNATMARLELQAFAFGDYSRQVFGH